MNHQIAAEYMAVVQEMFTPTHHIQQWLERIRSVSSTNVTPRQAQYLAELEKYVTRLYRALDEVDGSALMPSDLFEWFHYAFWLGGLTSAVAGHARILLHETDGRDDAAIPDYYLRNIEGAATYLRGLSFELRRIAHED